MLNGMGASLSDLASSDDKEEGQDEDDNEDTELSKLAEAEKPGGVMDTISKTVQHHMENVRQMHRRLVKLMQLGWGDTADYFREWDMKYRTTDFKVSAVVKAQTDTTTPTPLLTAVGELSHWLDIVPGQSQMPQVISWPGSSQMSLGLGKHQAHSHIAHVMPNMVLNWLEMEIVKPVELFSIYPCI